MEKKLEFSKILSNSIEIGSKNLPSILGCVVLWLLTIWIPYVNVGTTIALATLPAALSKGKIISPLTIFDKTYYKYMGEYFLVNGLKGIIQLAATAFLIVPAIVLSIAYSLSTLLVVDKNKGASEALKCSLNATYGYKWVIFFWYLALYAIAAIIASILMRIWSPLVIILVVALMVSIIGSKAYIYGQLTTDISDEDKSTSEMV
ncbi:MAG: hypothetical protein M0Q90_02495 [Bacteroidales bacterium]|nr:hypothetical protein [Bacteroidales bacterium]